MAVENTAPVEGAPTAETTEADDYIGIPSADVEPAGYVMPDGTTVLAEDDPEALATRPPAPEVEDEPTPSAKPDAALLARIEAAERRAEQAERLAQAARTPVEADIPDQPPVSKEEAATNPAKMLQYLEWKEAHMEQKAIRQARAEAHITSTAQHARGLLSETSMGKGLDFDTVVNTHIVPLERQSPATRALFESQKDPALVRYLIGSILMYQEKFGGDPAKTFAEFHRAMSGKTKETSNVLKKIAKAETNGATRTGMRQSRAAAPQGLPVYTAEQIERMNPAQYKAVMGAVRKGEAVLRDG